MGSFSLLHWIIVLAIVLLLFGPRRLPDLARGVGEAIREFKKAVNAPDQNQSTSAPHQIGQTQQQPPSLTHGQQPQAPTTTTTTTTHVDHQDPNKHT